MSEIFVDTIRKTGGSLGTDIRIKNTSVYESDGGTSVTQNIVQSLVKLWCHYDQNTDNVARDSLNVSSLQDDTTGNMTVNYTNNFNNLFYAVSTCIESGAYGSVMVIGHSGDPVNDSTEMTTALTQYETRHNLQSTPALFDPDAGMIHISGDLA